MRESMAEVWGGKEATSVQPADSRRQMQPVLVLQREAQEAGWEKAELL